MPGVGIPPENKWLQSAFSPSAFGPVGIGWLAFPAMGVSQNTALAPEYRSFLCKKDRINVL